MACARCGGRLPATPVIRPNLPTVFAWGPFPGHSVVDAEEGAAIVRALLGDA